MGIATLVKERNRTAPLDRPMDTIERTAPPVSRAKLRAAHRADLVEFQPARAEVLATPMANRASVATRRPLVRTMQRWVADHPGFGDTASQQALDAIAHTAYFRNR